uniref:Alpha/beta hydrolase fold-3 domain-containing protein n=1 Tax=Salvator merianae TaxID=96440 RepID=A0A8D0DR90_SALMN
NCTFTELCTNFPILEKFGICDQIHFIRYLTEFSPLGNDSELFVRDTEFEHVPVTIYEPKNPSPGLQRGVLYLHGGCGMFGNKSKLFRQLSCFYILFAFYYRYRLSPEHQPEIQLEDCLAVTKHLLKHAKDYGVDPNRVILCGESSGGSLVAGVCRTLVKSSHFAKPRAQMLLYPFLQLSNTSLPAHQQNRYGPILTVKRVVKLGLKFLHEDPRNYTKFEGLLNNCHVPEDMARSIKKWISADLIPEEFKIRGYEPPMPVPFSEELFIKTRISEEVLLSPILDEDHVIRQLPETYLLTCEYDILRDDGLLYKKRLEDNGVRITWTHLKDGFHGLVSFIDTGIYSIFFKPRIRNVFIMTLYLFQLPKGERCS